MGYLLLPPDWSGAAGAELPGTAAAPLPVHSRQSAAPQLEILRSGGCSTDTASDLPVPPHSYNTALHSIKLSTTEMPAYELNYNAKR